MDTLMRNEFEKRFDYNEWILDNEWRAKINNISRANNGIQNNFDNEKRV